MRVLFTQCYLGQVELVPCELPHSPHEADPRNAGRVIREVVVGGLDHGPLHEADIHHQLTCLGEAGCLPVHDTLFRPFTCLKSSLVIATMRKRLLTEVAMTWQ